MVSFSNVQNLDKQQDLIIMMDVIPENISSNNLIAHAETPLTATEFAIESNDLNRSKISMKDETWYSIAIQVFIPFIIAGLGMVAAGVVLDIVQHWKLFVEVKEIFIMIPALLGLKGNIEMTLASRLSTQVNLGHVTSRSEMIKALVGNLSLTQLQAIVVAFLTSMAATIVKLITEKEFDILKTLVLVSGSMCTASIASFLLGSIMIFIIIISRKFKINPDNIATPIAGSMGDLVSVGLLACITSFLYEYRQFYWLLILIVLAFILFIPITAYLSYKNNFVKEALYHGWTPIILAMCISSAGGVVFKYAGQIYKGIAVFQPVFNGAGGNVVSIFASRLSTFLHSSQKNDKNTREFSFRRFLFIPYETFFGDKNNEATTARILLVLAIPGHALFLFIITKVDAGHIQIHIFFTLSYLIAAFIQIIILLIVCYGFVHLIWKFNMNPDDICIPFMTATADLIGNTFLALLFHILYKLGESSLQSMMSSKLP